MEETLESKKLLGVKITTVSSKSILQYIHNTLKNKADKVFITTPNPEILVYAAKHPHFMKVLNTAQIALPDGVGITICAWIMGWGKIARITGVDMMETLALEASKNAYSLGLFGGMEGVAERAADCLRKKYPGVNIVYASSNLNLQKIKSQNIDILFVALGFPKQEEWIFENLGKIQARVAMGVGGSFDYFAGSVSRAPKFIRSIGMEWFYRLARQPWRWKRQLALIEYIRLIILEKFNKKSFTHST